MFTPAQRKILEENLAQRIIKIKSITLSDEAMLFLSEKLDEQFQQIALQRADISPLGACHLSKSLTINLKELLLNGNNIGNKGCNFFSRAKWPHLSYLCLNQNKFDSTGVLHLSKAKWIFLSSLVIMGNHLAHSALKYLIKIDCKNLQSLSITHKYLLNTLRIESKLNLLEVRQLLLGDWKALRLIWANMSEINCEAEIALLKIVFKEKLPNGAISLRC